jgi:predicted nucleic acid-binding protein
MRNERIAIDTNILLYILGGDKSLASLLAGKDVVASAKFRWVLMWRSVTRAR